MKKCLQLYIEPGYSLNQTFETPYWKFIIGMPLNQALDIISNYNGDHFRKVDFLYSHKTPVYMDIIINLMNEGIKLHFDPKCQRLKMIEVENLSLVCLYYCNNKFNDPPEPPSKERVIQVFGPAKIPEFDRTRRCYQLCYTGLTFCLSNLYSNNFYPDQHCIYINSLMEQLFATKLHIYYGKSVNDAEVPVEVPIECFLGNVLLDEIVVNRENYRTKEVEFNLVLVEKSISRVAAKLHCIGNSTVENIVRLKRTVRFGDSVQHVITALGAPNRTYFKTEDKMKIHSVKSQKDRIEKKFQTRKSDYFYNYLTLGVDIMFRFEDNRVSKFIFHTNFPDEFLFTTYYRCMFTFSMDRDDDSLDNINNDYELEESSSKFFVDSFSKWSHIQSKVSKRCDPVPVDINRFIDQCHKSGIGSRTLAYGVDDLIFEVIPENDHIASVTLYEVDDVADS